MTTSTARIRLRDITLADADLLDSWNADPDRAEFNDFGEPMSPLNREALAAGPLRNEQNGMLVVETADREPIGTVGWHKVRYGPNPESDAWNIGIELRPEWRGKGYGTEAQRELASWLFEHTGVNRVEAQTDIENIAEQRSLEKAGYVREGVARGSQFRRGTYRDLVTYSRLRGDPPET
jgi:RimJ/RimL family protein N-acetyltransferase